jgi:hypothetical protein
VAADSQTDGVELTVFVDNRQSDCCGEPFAVGSRMSWTLRRGSDVDRPWLAAVLGADVAATVDAAEEHHGGIPEDTRRTTGTVTWIAEVRYRRPQGRLLPDSGVVTEVAAVRKWAAHHGDLRMVGFLARLRLDGE